MYLVVRERLLREAVSAPEQFRAFQHRYDQWLRDHAARFDDVRHYLTVVGEPIEETWLHYPSFQALAEEQCHLASLEKDSRWQQLNRELHTYVERIESRIVEELERTPAEL
ncbi:MAG: hypothetical protein HYY04_19065 [Chloroflexi bacterium]|nr:hypothetical protein [Chloroflexota bacterium]